VSEATSDPRCEAKAVTQVLDHRYGKKRVAFDPNDPEANHLAMSKGYKVIHGGSLSKGQWANVRAAGAAKPAGQVTPSKKAIFSPDGEDINVPEDKWTPGMQRVVAYAREVGRAIMGFTPHVSVVRSQQGFAACYGDRSMMLNLQRLGHRFFNDDSPEGMLNVDKLLIHEYGHEYSDNHLSEDYYRALCKLGAKLAAWKAERGAGWEVSDA
jgi:hypothetical protein